MTTTVMVDAPVGWDVGVTCRAFKENGETVSVSTHRVTKNTQAPFYVHSNMEIIKIQELRNETS